MLVKLKNLINSQSIKKFISHNNKIFKDEKSIDNSGSREILVELNNIQSALISYSYLLNALAKKFDAKIIAYRPLKSSNIIDSFTFYIKYLLFSREFGIYKSFGVARFELIKISYGDKKKAHEKQVSIYRELKSNGDIELIVINGVLIGDLIYDTYLRRYNKPTISLADPKFKLFLKEFLESFYYWENYFNSHNIQAVSVSHCVYDLALPLRIAINRDIPAFQANLTHVYRMSRENLFAYGDYIHFPEIFSKLPKDVQKAGLECAKHRIQRRFDGEVGVDMEYSTKSAYGLRRNDKLLTQKNKKQILIATHCFFDSPHSYGNNIFPDFYEWLNFLGRISKITDYTWYIKTHPDPWPGTKDIIDDFVLRYPKFNLIPADASHNQIISEGIDFALTVYGTIGFEYAALGVPVINCSLNNPHIAYNFNVHPKSILEYTDILLNLEDIKFNIEKDDVYQYYFMRNIYGTENLFFNNYSEIIKSLGGYSGQFSDIIYEKWLEEWTYSKHQSILDAIDNFINSNEFRMGYKHFGRELTIELLGLK